MTTVMTESKDGYDDGFRMRFAAGYLEHEMPDADAATIEQAARAFLAALMDE